MQTLVIYDITGYPIQIMSGDIREPIGVPFMWVEVPEGKLIATIDVSAEEHVPVFVDIPKSAEQLQIESLQARQEASDAAIGELTLLILTPQL